MAIKLKNNLGRTINLTYDSAVRWLNAHVSKIPEFFLFKYVNIFLTKRDKTYDYSQWKLFLWDLEGFYYGYKGIDYALKNLQGYEKHLVTQEQKNKRLKMLGAKNKSAHQVLGVSKGTKISEDLQQFVEGAIDSVLQQERLYITECKESLQAQLQWHKSGAVDKWKISSEVLRNAFSVTQKGLKDIKNKAKFDYYEPIRNRLMSRGFVVSPPGAALGAVFPKKDWVGNVSEMEFRRKAKAFTDNLTQRYRLIGDDPTSLTRLLKAPDQPLVEITPPKGKRSGWGKDWDAVRDAFVSAVGCLCISWTRHKASGRTFYIPILGISGVVQEAPDSAYFQKFCRHLGLPSWKADPKTPSFPDYQRSSELQQKFNSVKEKAQKLGKAKLFNQKKHPNVIEFNKLKIQIQVQDKQAIEKHRDRIEDKNLAHELWVNYETMIRRTNLTAVSYRARNLLKLRKPARQALLSYVAFRENKSSKNLKIEELQEVSKGVDLWICGWHSLNCAEPAALMTASYYFGEGSDVLVCFPYEGFNDTGKFRNRPKETCPWCAAVELGFRSLSHSSDPDGRVASGKWLTQLTNTMKDEPKTVLSTKTGFDAFDDENTMMKSTRKTLGGIKSVGLVRNKDLTTSAYSDVVETKIGRIRSMYHLLGLLDPEVIALDRPLFKHSFYSF